MAEALEERRNASGCVLTVGCISQVWCIEGCTNGDYYVVELKYMYLKNSVCLYINVLLAYFY